MPGPRSNAVQCQACIRLLVQQTRSRRKLAVAVAEEDYNLAAQLNSEKQLLAQELPAVSQYTFHQLQQLQTGMEMGSLPQQLLAVRALGKSHIAGSSLIIYQIVCLCAVEARQPCSHMLAFCCSVIAS